MKKVFMFLVSIAVVLFSCTKGPVTPTTGNNNGGNNGGSGNNGGNNGGGSTANSITITSISPSNPYPDDEITITGTGFNPDVTKDTIWFGQLKNNLFNPWNAGGNGNESGRVIIESASATQLVIKAKDPLGVDLLSHQGRLRITDTIVARVQVRTGGNQAVSNTIPFKPYMHIISIKDIDKREPYGPVTPDDSVEIYGEGLANATLSINSNINSTQIHPVLISSDPLNNYYTFHFFLPKDFFGVIDNDTLTKEVTLTEKNPDGKTIKLTTRFKASPVMYVNSMTTPYNTYKISDLKNGATINVDIYGSCLAESCFIKEGLEGDPTFHYTKKIGEGNYPSHLSAGISWSSQLKVGQKYNIGLWRYSAKTSSNVVVRYCSFTIAN